MSNRSILERLENSLAAYARGEVTENAFIGFLNNSVSALEAVPFAVIHELGRHQRAIETQDYFEKERFECPEGSAVENLLSWIRELKRDDGQEGVSNAPAATAY